MLASTIHLPVEQQLSIAVRLFTRVRWIPPIVIVAGGALLRYGFHLQISLSALIQIAACIIAYNIYLAWRYRRDQPNTTAELLRLANLHMAMDFAAITLLVYYTGGVLSPLIWFYSAHIIMACIFFKRKIVVRTTVVLWLLLCLVFGGEYFGLIPHQHVYATLLDEKIFYGGAGFVLSVLVGAAILWVTLIWLVTLIIERVRADEQQEHELQVKYKATVDDLTESEHQRQVYRRSMTHELRSPIAAAQSIVRIMAAGAFGPLSGKQADGVHRVSRRLDQLMDMLQDVLAIERAARSEFHGVPTPLRPLIEQIVGEFEPQIEERRLQVELHLDDQAVALADPDDLRTILSNLISNAVKYSRDGGVLRIAAEVYRGNALVEIRDSGIGIPEKDQEKLFREFFRAGNAKQHTVNGTGLGLAIVKKLIQQNNGAILLNSEEGKGTTVTFNLPLAILAPAPATSPPPT
jgi:signal transduction histidine kinase